MSHPALVVFLIAVLFLLSLSAWSSAARFVDFRTIPARYQRRVLWWQANAHRAQLAACCVAAAALCAYVATSFA